MKNIERKVTQQWHRKVFAKKTFFSFLSPFFLEVVRIKWFNIFFEGEKVLY